jgi:hypothetical protein
MRGNDSATLNDVQLLTSGRKKGNLLTGAGRNDDNGVPSKHVGLPLANAGHKRQGGSFELPVTFFAAHLKTCLIDDKIRKIKMRYR